MAKDIPPVLRTDSTHLQPEPRAHLKRDDSGFFSPLSGGTTPVAATPQPIVEEEREAEMDGSGHDSRPPPLVRRHSSDDVRGGGGRGNCASVYVVVSLSVLSVKFGSKTNLNRTFCTGL